MKKFIALFVVVAFVFFFALPSLIFGEPGDNSTAEGPDSGGQYQMDPNDADYADDPEQAPSGEIMDVYCIDEDVHLNWDTDAYQEIDVDVSDELEADGVAPTDAEAVEIIATTATGASDSDNQEAVWDIIEDPDGAPENATVGEIVDAVKTIADGFVNDNPSNLELQEYLDSENVNEIDVTLDTDPLVDNDPLSPTYGDYNDFEATAIMENPLVPGVTDEDKTVFWYILAGSYNVSFSETSLLTEVVASSGTPSAMSDYADDASDVDGDGLVNTDNDHYGMATIPYYFYWWGEGYAEFEEMNVNIGACVDIDDDGYIDKEKQGGDLDQFNTDIKVVQVDDNGTPNDTSDDVVQVDDNGTPNDTSDDIVVTAIPDNVDIDYFNAGKVLVTITRDQAGDNYPTDQRFAIESYSEPCDSDSETYSAWGSFEVTKTNSVNQDPVPGAVYTLTYVGGQTYTPSTTVYILTTLADGKASVSGLPWGTYQLVETFSPPGYVLDTTVYGVEIGGTVLFGQGATIDATQDVQNDPEEEDGSITVCKFDAATGLPLEGSTFQLQMYVCPTNQIGNAFAVESAAAAIVSCDWINVGREVTLDKTNCYTWYELLFGDYRVVEVSAPAGYLTVGPIEVTIDRENPVGYVEFYDPRIPSRGSITLNKSGLDSTDVAGFTLYDSSNNPVGSEKTVTGNGTVQWTGLPKDTYKIVETTVPSGYSKMADITGIVVESGNLRYSFDRTNTKTPPGELEVLGIQELPFTGMHPAIPISGITMILGGAAMFIASLKKRFRRK